MKLILIVPALLYSLNNYAQVTYVDSTNTLCNHRISNALNLGVNLKITVPCRFDTIYEDRPNVVKEFIYRPEDGQIVGIAVSIVKGSKKNNYTRFSRRL